MTILVREDLKDDLLSRGYSRRHMLRGAMLLGGGAAAALSLGGERAFAADDDAGGKMIRIGSNECWTGPMAPGLAAGNAAFVNANRYSPNGEHEKLIKAISTVENVPVDHIGTYPGSGETLTRTIVAFCSPTKGLVQASPTYDNPTPVAKYPQCADRQRGADLGLSP